jgi:hypothetical protein
VTVAVGIGVAAGVVAVVALAAHRTDPQCGGGPRQNRGLAGASYRQADSGPEGKATGQATVLSAGDETLGRATISAAYRPREQLARPPR